MRQQNQRINRHDGTPRRKLSACRIGNPADAWSFYILLRGAGIHACQGCLDGNPRRIGNPADAWSFYILLRGAGIHACQGCLDGNPRRIGNPADAWSFYILLRGAGIHACQGCLDGNPRSVGNPADARPPSKKHPNHQKTARTTQAETTEQRKRAGELQEVQQRTLHTKQKIADSHTAYGNSRVARKGKNSPSMTISAIHCRGIP